MKEICQCKAGISVWREFHRMGQKGEQRTSYVKNGGGVGYVFSLPPQPAPKVKIYPTGYSGQ